MADELEYLQEISGFFKRMNVKIKLIGLINKAKEEYDNQLISVRLTGFNSEQNALMAEITDTNI